jgi:hypothetical protein
MTSGNPQPPGPDGIPAWARNPAVRYPVVILLVVSVGLVALSDGDAESVGYILFGIGIGGFGAASAFLIMRGAWGPTSYDRFVLRNPLGMGIMCVGFVVWGVGGLLDLLAPRERWAPFLVCAAVGLAFLFVGFIVQVLSWSSDWPDRWRPPYDRRRAEPGSTPGPADGGEP